MGMVVRSNLMAMNANRQLGMNNSSVSKSLEKLSSGFKINRAGDDASGLAISEKMKAQIKGLEQASSNSQDGISLVQTAEGALTEVHDMLNRMTELATKSANGTIQDEVDREAIQSEVDALLSEIDRIGDSTNFNGISLLDGSLSGTGTSSKAVSAEFKLSTAQAGAEVETDAVKGDYTHAALTSGVTVPTQIGDKVGVDYTFETADGAKKTVSIQLTYQKDDDGNAMLVSNSGQKYQAAAPAAPPIATDIEKAIFAELNNNSFIKSNFTVSNTASSNTFAFKARTAGATGVAKLTGVTDYSQAATANKPTYAAAQTVTITTAAEDSFKSIDLSKMKVYDGAGAATHNAKKIEDAVFMVGGKKFAFVSDALSADDLAKLDPSINYVTTSAGAAPAGGAANTDADKMAKLITQKTGVKAEFGTKGATSNSIDFKGGTVAGKANGGLTLQIGDTGDDFNMVTVNVDDMRSKSLGVAGLDVSNADAARNSIATVKDAINMVSTNRANLGALQNRLEHTINNLDVAAENMTAANSRIRDTDMAKQMMDYTKMNVLTQSAQAMLAQANQQPQSILQLLQ